jgi:hypothetical protein
MVSCCSKVLRPLFYLALFSCSLSVNARDELLVNVFSAGVPVSGAAIIIDGVAEGKTSLDGSLLIDVNGAGTHTLGVETIDGAVTSRFTSGAGQLVDAIVEFDQQAIFIDVYSQTESVSERKSASKGTLNIHVTRGGASAEEESVYITGHGRSLQTDGSGETTVTLPRGRYRTQVAEKIVNLRVVGGLTRAVHLQINEHEQRMHVAQPQLEEVVVMGSFDPAGLEVSERDTANIVDTIGVELLARFADSDIAASVVRVP